MAGKKGASRDALNSGAIGLSPWHRPLARSGAANFFQAEPFDELLRPIDRLHLARIVGKLARIDCAAELHFVEPRSRPTARRDRPARLCQPSFGARTRGDRETDRRAPATRPRNRECSARVCSYQPGRRLRSPASDRAASARAGLVTSALRVSRSADRRAAPRPVARRRTCWRARRAISATHRA